MSTPPADEQGLVPGTVGSQEQISSDAQFGGGDYPNAKIADIALSELGRNRTLAGTVLEGTFTTNFFSCSGRTNIDFGGPATLTPTTSPYSGTGRLGGTITRGFSGPPGFIPDRTSLSFDITTPDGTKISGTASGSSGGGCQGPGFFGVSSLEPARYSATITTPGGGSFQDGGTARLNLTGAVGSSGGGASGRSTLRFTPRAQSLPAVVRASTGWMLRDSLTSGPPTNSFTYGSRPLVPLMGDWDGDGDKTAATYESGVFKQRNSNSSGPPDITFTFGDPRGFPIAGDFNGDGSDDVAVYRNGTWQVRLSNGVGFSPFAFGSGNWPSTVPVAGDWDGDGTDGIGTFTSSTATWDLRNTATAGPADAGSFAFGTAGASYPVTGDWDASGNDTVGVKQSAGSTWSIRNANSAGAPDLTFDYGQANDFPLTWQNP